MKDYADRIEELAQRYEQQAFESRWQIFAEVDVDAAAKLAIPTPD